MTAATAAAAAPGPSADLTGGRHPAPRASIDPDTAKGWLRRLVPVVGAHRRLVAFSLLGALGFLLLNVAVPIVTRAGVDAVAAAVEGRPHRAIRDIVVAMALVGVGRFVFGFVYRYGIAKVGLEIEYDLRNLLYAHLVRLPFPFYDRVQSGQLISRANSDIRTVQLFLTFAPSLLVTMVTFAVALVFMVAIHPLLTLVAVLTLPGVYVAGVKMRNVMFPSSWLLSSRTADLATVVEENVTGVRVVKSFAAEEQQIRAMHRAAERLLWASNLAVELRARWSPLLQNLPRLAQALVLLYGGILVIDGEVTPGTLVAFMFYVLLLQSPFQMLGFLLMMANRARASAERVFEILDEAPEITDDPAATVLSGCRGEVELRGVRFGYGDRDAAGATAILDGLDLHLRPGETVALVGRTGSGKSTVARLIPRFYDVWDGAVLVDGHDVRHVTQQSLRDAVGLVLDEPFLFSESIRDNIAYGRPDASMDDVVAAATAAGAADFVEALPDGYDTVIGERGYTLSGGQRQRLAIARTLLVNPPILILDDATSSIDVHREQEIHGALRTLMAGRTTLIIAHRLSTISLADRVVFLDGGRIVADGTHAELSRTVPAYAEVLASGDAEEDAPATDSSDGDPLAALPPRLRAMARLAEARDERAATAALPFAGGGAGGGGGGS